MISNEFLIVTRTKWLEPPRARHQLATELSINNKVYFLEANKIGFPKLKIKKETDNLTLITPYWPISYKLRFRLPLVNEMFQLWLLKKIINYYKNNVIINFDHTFHKLRKHFGKKLIYYCTDDHIRTYKIPIPFLKKYFIHCERKTAMNSDLCISTSDYLVQKLTKYNINSFLILLGAPNIETSYYSKTASDKIIKVVLIGFISEKRVPISVLFDILGNNNYELNIYGIIDRPMLNKFENFSNFVYHGVKKNNELYHEVGKAHVAIALYNKDDVNKGGTPNKLWLYLALGKPIVVTELDAIKSWEFNPKFVYKSKNNEDFIELIQKAYDEDNEELFGQRMKFAEQNSWSYRVKELIQLLEDRNP